MTQIKLLMVCEQVGQVFLLSETQGKVRAVERGRIGPKEGKDAGRASPKSLQPCGPVVKNACFLAEDVGLIPSQGTKIPHTTMQGQKVNKSK